MVLSSHRCIADDFYEGCFIPEGSLVIANVWEMNRDPMIFGDDAHLFNPARFLDEKGQLLSSMPGAKDDGHYTFGGYIAVDVSHTGLIVFLGFGRR